MTKQKQGYSIDMLTGPLWGKVLLFALPLMLSSVLQLLFNAADVVVVGRFAGKEALAAVGSTSSLINLFVNLFIGLSVGTNVTVARDLGAGRADNVSRSVHTSIALALISGALLTVAGVALSGQMLVLMKSPPDVIDLSALYLRIYFCGMPANMLYNFGSAILRAQGDTRRPLYFLSAAGIINVVLNLVFVIPLRMSVAGVALATIISQYISAALVLMALIRDDGLLKFSFRQLCLDRNVIVRILRVGLPAGFQSVLFSISNVVIQSAVNSFNSTVVAGCSAASNIESFVYASMNAFYQTALTFTSQNYGAGKHKRVDRTMLVCMFYTAVIGLTLGNLVYLFGHPLVSLYVPGEEEVITQALARMRIVSTTYFICGLMEIPVGVLRGIGYSLVPMITSLLGSCALRLAWVAFVFPLSPTIQMLYTAYPVTWLVTAAAHYFFFLLIRKHAYPKADNTASLQES